MNINNSHGWVAVLAPAQPNESTEDFARRVEAYQAEVKAQAERAAALRERFRDRYK